MCNDGKNNSVGDGFYKFFYTFDLYISSSEYKRVV